MSQLAIVRSLDASALELLAAKAACDTAKTAYDSAKAAYLPYEQDYACELGTINLRAAHTRPGPIDTSATEKAIAEARKLLTKVLAGKAPASSTIERVINGLELRRRSAVSVKATVAVKVAT